MAADEDIRGGAVLWVVVAWLMLLGGLALWWWLR